VAGRATRVAGRATRVEVLAVDGGNSKTDVVLVGADGSVLGAVRGPTVSHQQIGVRAGLARLAALVAAAGARAGLDGVGRPTARRAVLCLAGADFPTDIRLLQRGVEELGIADSVTIENDTFAGLRAGASRPWGVVVVMGRGVNVGAIAPDGKRLVHAPGDPTSGDWGGGHEAGVRALSAAVRARDGRGPRTSLERLVPAHFGLTRPLAVTRAIYDGRIDEGRLDELSPVVFEAATAGDAVARGIVDWLADEAVLLALSAIRGLRLNRLDPEVVLSGGVFRATDRGFHDRIRDGILAIAPRATVIPLTVPPVVGAALLGLDDLHGRGSDAERRLRSELTDHPLPLTQPATPRRRDGRRAVR
jgi:N-acetylglucosamine kinase-like BadF-type ATPase